MPKYFIEHLEPELFEWCVIEYEHTSKIVGKKKLIFTNIKNREYKKTLEKYGEIFKKKVADLDDLNFKKVCVLDSNAKKTLLTEDKCKFQYFVFGGILGDNPPQKRTQQLIKKLKKNGIKFSTRNLGKKQLATDTAVYVTKKILEGKNFDRIKFFDNLEIEVDKNESVILPYRYISEDEKPIINKKIIEYLKRKKEF